MRMQKPADLVKHHQGKRLAGGQSLVAQLARFVHIVRSCRPSGAGIVFYSSVYQHTRIAYHAAQESQ